MIEDDQFFAAELKAWLQKERYIVDTSQTGEDGLYRLKHFEYDLAIVDWMLPDMEGVQICKLIRQEKEQFPLLMLTSRRDLSDRIEGLDSGAMDYLAKPCDLLELSARLRALLRRKPEAERLEFSFIDLKLLPLTREAICGGKPLKLSALEFDLLLLLTKNLDRAASRQFIAASLSTNQEDFSESQVRSHIWKLRRHLNAADSQTSILHESGKGYSLSKRMAEPGKEES